MSSVAEHPYFERFRRVVEFIDTHLDASLSVEQLSSIANFSKFHFHRQFSEWFGLSLYEYVQLKRLKRASYQLTFRPQTRVLDIALGCGYEGPEAFARAFKKRQGQTPTAFREQPDWVSWHAIYQPLSIPEIVEMHEKHWERQVRLIDFAETGVAVLRHRGDPNGIGDSIRRFIAWRKQTGLGPNVSATFNILYNDPASVPPDEYRLDICAATDREIGANEFGVVADVISGGRCAVLRHVGADDALRVSIKYLYFEWLPHSGEELRDYPLFLQRLRFFPDVGEHEAVTDIFLPLVDRPLG